MSLYDPPRPHCLDRDDCQAKKPNKHCRRCSGAIPEVRARRAEGARRAANHPDERRRRSENAKARFADPAERKRMSQIKIETLKDPAKRAKVVTALRKMVSTRGSTFRPEQRAEWIASLTPEQRSKIFGRRGFKGGLSGADLELYETLTRKGVTAREARQMVDEEARRTIDRITREMHEKRAREKAQAY